MMKGFVSDDCIGEVWNVPIGLKNHFHNVKVLTGVPVPFTSLDVGVLSLRTYQ